MPRNGSNVYSPPAGTTATTATTIESAKYNAFVSDLTTLANEARPVSVGGTGATAPTAARANLGLVIGTDVQAQNATLSTIASQGNVATGQIADNAVTTAKVANGAITEDKLATLPGMVRLETEVASASASLVFTAFDASKYGVYVFEVENLRPTDRLPSTPTIIQLSADGGSTWVSTGYDSALKTESVSNAGGGIVVTSTNGPVLAQPEGNLATDSNRGWNGRITVRNMGTTEYTSVTSRGVFRDVNGNLMQGNGYSEQQAAVAHNALRFIVSGSATTLQAGTVTMYGLRKA